MLHLIFVTGDEAACKPLKAGLLEQGVGVSMATPEAVMSDAFSPGKVDVLILDVEHSRLDLHKFCHVVKRDAVLKDVPLVLLVPEAQFGHLEFSWGIDDYLTTPVSVARLVERVKFLMWKANRIEPANGLKLGDLAMDFVRYEIHLRGEPIDLTYKEFELLKFLATQPGRVFSREVLLNKVWGYDYYGGTRTVDVHIRRLRSKLEDARHTFIDTIRHVGYKFLPPEE